MKDSKTQYLQIKQFKKNEDTCSETEFCVLPMDGGAGYKGFLCYLSCVDSDDMKALSSADVQPMGDRVFCLRLSGRLTGAVWYRRCPDPEGFVRREILRNL